MNFSSSGQARRTRDLIRSSNTINENKGSDSSNTPQQQSSSKNGFTVPSISLPKGGGAIRGIGEKFAANSVTGTGSLTVPIFTSPGRSGFGPSLSLSYDSASGNGPFGFGWSLSLPSITRKTSKGIPKYEEANESDVFILSESEDLVPVFSKINGGCEPANVLDDNPNTRWSSSGVDKWINADLGSTQSICSVNIAWYKGNERVYSFVIATSIDGATFTNVFAGSNSGNTIESEKYEFANADARYVRVTINGNNINRSASITELDIFGSSSPSAPSGCSTNIPISGVTASDCDEDWEKNEDGDYVIDEVSRDGYTVRKYRPRTEGLFARIERWTHNANGDVHWRSISKDNVLTVYGKNKESRIVDPSDEKKIYSWLICESYDDKGNAIVYKYAREDEKGIDDILSNLNERNRKRTANAYIKRIFYGNRKPLLLDPTKESFRKSHLEILEDDLSLLSAKWMFQVVFDYDDGHYNEINKPTDEQHQLIEASADAGSLWSGRPDVFSTYRASFEVRTYRRCHRVLMFHHFTELGTEPYLVRSTEFDYSDLDYSSPRSITISEELGHKGSTRFASFIQNIVQSGYLKDDTSYVHEINGVKFITYIKKSIPPLEFEYSKCVISHNIKEFDETSLENLPVGVDGSSYQFVDLDGDATYGILTEQADTWYYKPSLGDGNFGPVQVIKAKPSIGGLNDGRQQLVDLAADGQLDVVDMGGPTAGLYERNNEGSWENFVPFQFIPNIEWSDPNIWFVDLTGDRHADILITDNEVFTWYQSLAEKGFAPSERVMQELSEEKGPRIVLNDSSQSVYLADMDGDALSDLVSIKNGEVSYWPNLGYGKFGSKITMDNSPWFDSPDQFDAKKLRLADADGTGIPDIFYIGASKYNGGGIQIYFNQSGNRWSAAYNLDLGLELDNHSSVQVTDLFGNGTACIVWSSSLPAHSRKPIKYLDLMGGKTSDGRSDEPVAGTKPHLLVRSANNLGAETRVKYVSSTKFYLEDKIAGKPWITRLPFPVQVVQQVETYDYISRNLFVTQYKYHHGYFDGIEQEFRGFGMVEQFDTAGFAFLSNSDTIPNAENVAEDSHVPPVYTKTWFHTGIYEGRDHVSDYFSGLLGLQDRGEYYREPAWEFNDAEARKYLLNDTTLPSDLRIDEEFEASRALRGAMLRQEVYSKDGTEVQENPYNVTEQNFTIRVLQPRGNNAHGIFFAHPKELITYNYERNPEDPRTSHTMTLEADEFGNILKQVQIGYGRRVEDPTLPLQEDRDKQTEKHIIYAENEVTKCIDLVDAYRNSLPCETVSYELTGYDYSDKIGRFVDSDFVKQDVINPRKLILDFDSSLDYEGMPTGERQRRPIDHMRILFRKNDLSSMQRLGEMESLALPGDSYKLCFTPGLIDTVYKRPDPDNPGVIEKLLPTPESVLGGNGPGNGGYVASQQLKAEGLFPQDDPDYHWWVPSGRIFFSPDSIHEQLAYAAEHFYLPHGYLDPFGNPTTVSFDVDNFLLAVKVEDRIGNVVAVDRTDYRLLKPSVITDANQNRSMMAFDVLGMVVGTAVMGKEEPATQEGDNLDGFNSILTTKEILDHIANPENNPDFILKNATTRLLYDFFSYYRTKDQPEPKPPVVYTLVRETHFVDSIVENKITKIQHSFSYSDGFGREIQKKIQSEGPPWVGTGWKIYNNKGNLVRQYEPFFCDTHEYKFKPLEGISPIIFYDPMERVIAVLHPNHTYEKVVFDNWKQATYDVNDTVLSDPRTDADISHIVNRYFESLPDPNEWKTWYEERIGNPSTPADEKSAAKKTEAHADTPTTTFFDSLGRSFVTLVHNGFEGQHIAKQFPTRLELDIEGNTRKVQDEIVKNDGEKIIRTIIEYDYNILGTVIHQSSMDAGQRWSLDDASGNPIRAWDSKRRTFITQYDKARRPIRSYVLEPESADPDNISSTLVERIVYGEQHPDDTLHNLRGKIYLYLDQAGILRNQSYDFKGNILSSVRLLTGQYKNKLNWEAIDNVIPANAQVKLNLTSFDEALASLPDDDRMKETFTMSKKFDALNRPLLVESPHNHIMPPNFIKPSYNKGNLLEKLEVNLRSEETNGEKIWIPFVVNIDYDARGRRTLIEYGSGFVADEHHGVITKYSYDEKTFKLKKLVTMRNLKIFPDDCLSLPDSPIPNGCDIQNLSYTYDPIGNVTKINDKAQQSIFFHSHWVEPSSEYTYDPLYRLIEATGREHLGQVRGAPVPYSSSPNSFTGVGSPNDGNLMGNYIENYEYDGSDNITLMKHYSPDQMSNPKWVRVYSYNEPSLNDPLSNFIHNNQLSNTVIHRENTENTLTEEYIHDKHGNIIRMPHLRHHLNSTEANMHFNQKDQLQKIDMPGEGTAFYVYDASGQRVRKVLEKSPGLTEDQIYLGSVELFRKQNGFGTIKLERETLHVMDDKQERIALVETVTVNEGEETLVPSPLIRYQMANHLGSVCLELDDTAQIITYEEYTPYGSTSFEGLRILGEVERKRYRYSGMERDIESGFDYHLARYYLPWLGRWSSCDPIGIMGGLNLFVYANNSPVVWIDKDGKEVEFPMTEDAKKLHQKTTGKRWNGDTQMLITPLKDRVKPKTSSAEKKGTSAQKQTTVTTGQEKGSGEANEAGGEANEAGGEANEAGGEANEGGTGDTGTGTGTQKIEGREGGTGSQQGKGKQGTGQDQSNGGGGWGKGPIRLAKWLVTTLKVLALATAIFMTFTAIGAIVNGFRIAGAFGAIRAAATTGTVATAAIGGASNMTNALQAGSDAASNATSVLRSSSGAIPKNAPPEIEPGGTGKAFAGHGKEYLDKTTVPEGTTVFAPPFNYGLPESMGRAIETGDWATVAKDPVLGQKGWFDITGGFRVFGPGSEMPNFRLLYGNGCTLSQNSIRVDVTTPISDLMQPNMGDVFWAACTLCKR